MARSAYLKNKILDAIGNAAAFSVTTVTVSLHTATPGTNGANEVTGGSYAKQTASFGAANAGAMANDAAINFAGMPEILDPTFITHVGLWDGANFLQGGALATPREVAAGSTFSIAIGDLDLTEEDV